MSPVNYWIWGIGGTVLALLYSGVIISLKIDDVNENRRQRIPEPKNQDKFAPRDLDIDYIKTVCKSKNPSETCRYLFCGPKGFECGKAGMMRKICDEKAMRGQTFALGDNCGGQL